MLVLLHKCKYPMVLGSENGGSSIFCLNCRHAQGSEYGIDGEQRQKESESQSVRDVTYIW